MENINKNGSDLGKPELPKLEFRKRLAAEVEKFPCLWDTNRKDHHDSNVIKPAWDEVSLGLKTDVGVCKKAWKTMKMCRLYHERNGGAVKFCESSGVQKKLTSMDPALWKGLQFLGGTDDVKGAHVLEETPPATPISSNLEDEGVIYYEEVFTDTDEISIPEEPTVVDKDHGTQLIPAAQLIQPLRYQSMYANLDRMLCKLPEATVENLNVLFTLGAHKALLEHQNTDLAVQVDSEQRTQDN